jgi:hypothetical protein
MAERKKLLNVLGLAAVLLVGAALRLSLVPAQLPYHYHADEFQVVERALRVGAGNPNPGLFTWPGSLVIYLDFILYAGYFAIAFLTGMVSSATDFARLYWTDPSVFYLLGRLLSMSFGLLAVWAIYYIADRLYNMNTSEDAGYSPAAGLIAAASFALMPQAIISSAQTLPDMAAALALTALAVAVGHRGATGWKRAALTGLLLGFAVASKYHAILYAIPLVGLILVDNRSLTGGLKNTALVAAGLIVGFVVACPFALLDFRTFAGDVAAMVKRPGMAVFAPAPAYLFATTLRLGMSWPLLLFGAAGIVWCVIKRFKVVGLIILLLALPYVVIAIPRPLPPRHLLPLYPAFAVGAGVFAADLYNRAKNNTRRSPVYITLILIAAILLVVAVNDIKLIAWENREDSRTSALKYIEDTVPAGSIILTEAVEPDVTSPYLWPDPESLERIGKYRREKGLGGGERVARLLADPAYPFEKPAYGVYLVEMYNDLGAIGAGYAVRCIPDDERFFAEQGKPPGTRLNEWDERYARFLRERGELLATFSGAGRPGPTVEIYGIKP